MKTVLCIDDALLVRTEMKKILDKKGINILTAENGRQALEVLTNNKDVNLIFCDMNMPEMNGLEFCRNYFEKEEWRTIPLFMLTTESDMSLKEESKKYGAKGWLVKPFTEVKINAVLEKILGK